MELFTTQISKWRLARQHQIAFVDTTVQSGSARIFAPTWDIVTGYKGGEYGEEQYTHEYHALMRASYQKHQKKWDGFLMMEEPLAIACYCSPGQFCHRHLLKNIFEQLCKRKGLPFLYYGELE